MPGQHLRRRKQIYPPQNLTNEKVRCPEQTGLTGLTGTSRDPLWIAIKDALASALAIWVEFLEVSGRLSNNER